MLAALLLVTAAATDAVAGNGKTIGKNPGKIKGRWLRVEDTDALQGL